MRKERLIVLGIILSILSIIIIIHIPYKDDNNNMTNYKYYNYKDLGITSTRKPSNTHLLIETSAGILYLVDSVDQTKLYKSTDKGDNWTLITTRTRKIQSCYYNRTTGKIWFVDCDNDGVDNNVDVWHLTLSNDSITEIGTKAHISTTLAFDIWYDGVNMLIIVIDTEIYADEFIFIYSVDAFPFTNLEIMDATLAGSSYIIVVGDYSYFYSVKDGDVTLFSYERVGTDLTIMDIIADYTMPTSRDQRAISYDNSDLLYFILKKDADSKDYLAVYSISDEAITILAKHNVALMLDRNTATGVMEKGFHLTLDRVYQIPSNYNGRLNWISAFDFSDTIIAITDNFLIDNSGNVYEYVDLISSILKGLLFHSRQDYPYLQMRYNSDNITILTQMFIEIIGPYTVDGSTTSNQVVFEGIAKRPTKGRFQHVEVENQSSEMDQVKPRGIKAGRSDQIISDINDDGAPTGPEYIANGTLAEGSAMGTLDLSGAKDYRTVLDDFADHDGFLWSIRTQGALDYNAGGVDSGADLRYDGSGNLDTILELKAWTIAKLNQIIVNGAINPITGIPYSGQWDDEDDQQQNGINPITIEDAQLNSNALCQAKADEMGANEVERTRARFKFSKTTYGFIQPGQTITFKYDVTNYMTISEAQYILDKLTMNIKTEIGFAEISSGL